MATKQFLTDADFEDTGPLKPVQTGVLGRAGDLGLSVLKGTMAVPEFLVGVANIPTGGKAGKAVEQAGVRFKDAKQILDDQMSVAGQLAQRKYERADGFTGKVGAAIQNPSIISSGIAESVGPMGAGMAVGRGLMAVAPRALGGLAGAIGEGVVGAGSAAEQIRQQTADGELTGKQAALAGATGLATTAFGALGNKIGNKLGVGDIDNALIGGAASQAPAKQAGLAKRVAGGAFSEGVLEELPQSVSEQMLQNVALDRDPMQGVDSAAAMGLVTGGAMGAGFGILNRGQAPEAAQPPAQPPVAPSTTPGAPPAATPPAGPTLGQSLTGTPMADLMGGGGLTGGANPLQAGLSTLTSNNRIYPGMNTEPTGYTVDPETGAIIPAEPVGVRQMAEPAAQVEAPAPVAMPAGRTLGESLTGTPVSDMLGSSGMSGPANPLQSVLDTSTPSQRMGLNPAVGGLTAAAAIAVDSGASPITAGMGLRALSGAAPAAQPVAEQATPQQQEQPSAQQPILNNGKPFTLAEVGKANQAIGGTAVSVPGGWAIQPPQPTQQPTVTPATAIQPAATPASSAQSAILGRNSQPIAEGGQPFATREEAKAEKRLQPLMRVAPAESGGFILKPASERQLAAVEKAAKRLKYPSTGEAGPRSLHGFILQIGGLASGAMPDVGFDLNPRVGNRRLFSPRGKTIEQAAIAAKQEGYIQDEDENTLIEALKRSLNVSPVYTPDGYEAMAEAQMQARYEDFIAAEQDGGAENDWSRLTPEELADTGYNDYDEATQAEIRARVAQAEALGVDAESILEDVARRTENATQKDYENAAKSAIEAAIRSSEESRSRDLGQASAEAGPATADTQSEPAAVTGPASDVRARNLAALKARMMGQKKPTPTTPPAPNQQATPAPEAGPTNQGATNGQKETLLKAEQPTGAAAMVSGAPVATGNTGNAGNAAAGDTTKPGGFIENAKKAAGKVDAAPAQPILTSPTKADIEAQQARAEQAAKAKAAQDKADAARAAKERERKEVAAASVAAADTFELGQDAMANLTGQQDVFGGVTEDEIAPVQRSIEDMRRKLIDLENKIVGAAGMAPGFIEDAMKSRKVPTALKQQRNDLKAEMRAERERVQIAQTEARASSTQPTPPKATELTPKQYHEAKLAFIAADTGASMADVRENYDTEAGRAENDREWAGQVERAANAGEVLTSKTLDKLYKMAPNVRLPEAAIPQGYQRSEARKAEAEDKQARIDGRKAAKADAGKSDAGDKKPVSVTTDDANQKNSGGGLPSPIASKKTYSALLPFNIQGNKTQLLANGMDAFLRNAAKGARRVIDAFGGAAAYTHALSHNGDLPTGSVYNEFEPLRYITNKQIKENVEQVIARLEFHIGKINAIIDQAKNSPTIARKLTADYVINGINSHKQDGVPEHAKGLKSPPSNMADSPDLAALYLIAQNSRFGYRPIQSDVGEDGKLRVMSDGENELVAIREGGEKVTLFGRGKDKLINSASNLRAASKRLQGVDVRMGDGWMIGAKEASAGDVLLVDTSYLNKTDKNTGKTVETANYNKATQEDAIPAVYKEKVTENLLPAWDRGAKIVITNNWNDDVAAYLKNLGFTVIQDQRAKGVSNDTRELIAINFDQRTGEVVRRRGVVSDGASGRSGEATQRRGNVPTGQDGVRGLASGAEGQNGAVPQSGRGRLNPSTGSGKADARNAALASVVRNGGNSTAVLTDIAKNSTNPAFKLVAKAILAKGMPFDLRIRTDFTDGKVAHYSTDGHFVEFDPGMPFNLEQVLLHEAVHAVTSKYVASFGDSTPLGKELAALFKLAEQHAKKTGAKFYGLTNADEFLAEVMTNADFAQWLDTVPVPLQKSALSRFVRAVARFFGIQKADGATAQAIDVFERIMLAQSDLQAEASQRLSTSKDAAAVADAYGVDTEEDGDSVYFGDAEVMLNDEDNTYIVTSENEFTPDHRAAVAWAENNGFTSNFSKSPPANLTPVESMLLDALEATGDMGAAKDMAYEALRRQGVTVKWQEVVDAAKKMGRGTRASKPGVDAGRTDTTESPLTPASTIRAAITKAYGNLLDKLEGKGLVTIAQTEREAIEAAAQARADKTGGDVERIKRSMLASVQASVLGKDRIVYRGTTGSTERIKGGIAEGLLFAAAEESTARLYGPIIEGIKLKATANVLVEGTREFAKVTGRRAGKLINTMRKGENLKTAADEAVKLARDAGFDAVEFTSYKDLGIAIINESAVERDIDIKRSANGNIEGFFDKQTGKSFLVADNLTAASAPGTLMHEVGIHMAADGKLEPLFKRAGSLLKTGTQNEFIQRVKSRMARAGETSDEEAAAYIVTEYENDRAKAPITIGKWLADLTAAVRAWLFSKGVILKADQLTVADIAAVARANALSMARGGADGGPGGGQAFSRTALPATLNIDGKDRPTTNSNGQPIHPTKEGVRNFYRWFGDSKVVDEQGRPLVMYHGTSMDKDFSKFKVGKRGAWFTSNNEIASEYAEQNDSQEDKYNPDTRRYEKINYAGRVMPVYLKIERPYKLTIEDKAKVNVGNYARAQRELFAGLSGSDGILWNDSLSKEWVVLDSPTQIKSATGNTGAFSPTDPDIRFSRGGGIDHADLGTVGESDSPSSQWDAPLASSWDDKLYKLQDKNIDTKRVIQAIKKMAGDIQDKLNVYLQEELYHGRTAKRVLEFGRGELNPALDELAAMGYSIEDLEEYMHARHAPEANVVLAARNPTREMIDTARAEAKAEIKRLKAELSVDGLGKDEAKALKAELKKAEAKLKSWTGVAAFKGTEEERNSLSGMKTEEAEAYFRNLPAADAAKLKKVAEKMDAIMAETSNMMVAYHLESQETVDGWNAMYRHYIPLHREGKDDGSMGTGQGFSIKGREVKGRTGSKRKVVNIVAHIAEAREKTIVRGEKNRVAQALVGLVTKYPNADFWKTGAPPSERVFDRATGKVKNQVNPAYKSLPNVMMAKVMGEDGKVKEVAVTFNENDERAVRMAGALKNLDTPQIEGWLGTVAKATRYFAAVNTQYNPIFGAVNLVRDVQGAMINLGATPLADQKMKIARDSVDALAGIYRDIRATRRGDVGSSRWSELYEQFQHDGGQTGFRNLFETTDDRSQELKDRVSPTDWAKSPLGRIMSANGKLTKQAQWMRDGWAIARDWLSDYNETMESATRLAVYKAALDKGMTREQAASMAKNITVNFNRKGTMGTQAGALYAFFNAAMQGTARMGETLVTMEPGQPKTMRLSAFGKKVVYGGVLLGAVQALALAAGGFGDEEPPDFERERNLLIPTGWTGVGPDKGYIKIPMPLGLHVIPGIGRMGMEFVLSGGEDPAKAAIKFGSMMADAFNPIGNAGLSMQTIAPTVLDPLAALVENKDWTSKNIARESFNKDAPMFIQHKDSATFVAKFLAELVNYATGGNEYVGGALNWSPDQIDYLIGQVTGGVGRELSKVEQTATGAFTGDETPIYKVPLLGRFAGSASGKSGEANAFYTNADKLNRLETELKGMVKDGKSAEATALRMERPESRMIVSFNMAERQVQKLRKQKSALIEAGASAADVRAVDERITAIMQNMNQRMLSVAGN